MIACGLDAGSCMTKCVLMNEGKIMARTQAPSLPDIREAASKVFLQTCEKASIPSSTPIVVATGYGAGMVPFSNSLINEISATIKGALYFYKEKFSGIIDIGGEDTKVVTMDKNGVIKDLLLNDRCSAGTGRFLERMSKTLGTNIEGLSNLYFLSKKKLSINSTCTVFAESEVISLLSSGQRREDVAAAIINCICKNVCSLAYPLKGGKVFVCGGVAKNAAVIEELRRHFSNFLWIPPFPEFVAATGAALSAG